MKRLLMPFTYGIDVHAINQALRFARDFDAILVPLSLICLKDQGSRRVRLELIQQSKDFLEIVRCRAEKMQVPLESLECYTCDILQDIHTLARERNNASILLFTRGDTGVLLPIEQIKQLVEAKQDSLYLVSLPVQKSAFSWLKRLTHSSQVHENTLQASFVSDQQKLIHPTI
jgi:hypothetical protein